MKKKKNISKKRSKANLALLSFGVVAVTAFTITLNVLTLTKFDNVLEQFFKSTPAGTRGDTHGADTEYVKSDFSTSKELYEYEEKLCAEIAQDGATLLKNDSLLPLNEGTQLDLYSVSSVQLVSGGSGSGSGSFELTKDLKEGLEHAGFSVNQKLWDFYKSGKGSKYGRGIGVVNYGRGFDWKINECPLSVIQSDESVMNSIDKNNVAMFVISRTGGEGGDEPRDMKEFGGNRGEHYLELNTEEKEIIQFLGKNYNQVIILVNSNNAFELGWIHSEEYKNIKAVINFPGAGRTGTYGLGYFLRGKDGNGKEISPSGHLVDTLVVDNFSSPAMQNFGDAAFTDEQGRVIMCWDGKVTYGNGQYGNGSENINEDAGRCPFYFVSYNEGVYVGYKYYETRYEDYVLGTENVGEYDYASTVVYPFGYGSSYTTFQWSNFTSTSPDEEGNIHVTVDVKNTGERSGRDVVELYYQSPYTDYDKEHHIEKPAVNLVGFAKTEMIAPQSTKTVEMDVNIRDFRSYDDSGEGRYLLEAGDYYLTAASDAHMAVNNILKAKLPANSENLQKICETSAITHQTEMESSKYLVAAQTLEEVVYDDVHNLFSDATLIDRSEYLSRKNWSKMDQNGIRYATSQVDVNCPGVGKNPWGNTHIAACAEIDGKQFRAVLPEGLLDRLKSSDSLIPEEKKEDNSTAPKLNQKHNIDLIDMRGLPYDDPKWDLLLEQVSVEELSKLVAQCGYCSPAMDSIHKPKVMDLDGPAGLNQVVGHGSAPIGDGLVAMTWVTEYMLACTWDLDLATKMGEAVGEDGLHGDIVGWYGPAMNLHRTPFSGRNFEYYSEDSFLSGMMGKSEVQGAARKGLYGFIKHFAMNDQETHRDQNGLLTFSNEQAMREIYFKPFELTIRDNEVDVKYNEAIYDEHGKIKSYEMKVAKMPATTAVMSSFNRIGATWAGGNYRLITNVLREEFGFKGFVLTDYDTGSYMIKNTKQMLEAGGDGKLNTIGEWSGLQTGKDRNENIRYALKAAKNICYTVVNSAAMNGYVHGVRFVPGFAYYKLILIAWDVLAIGFLAFCTWKIVTNTKNIYKKAKEENEVPQEKVE